MKNKKVIHVGIHSGSNVGDVAITEVIEKFVVLSKSYYVKQAFNAKEYEGTGKLLKLLSMFISTYSKSKDADTGVIGGGNILMGNDLVFPLQAFIHTLALKLSRTRVLFYSVGVGPFNGYLPKLFIKLALMLSDKVICRDQMSSLELTDLGVDNEIIEDPVFAFKHVNPSTAYDKKYDVGISVMALGDEKLFPNGGSEKNKANFINNLVQVIENLKSKNLKIFLFVTDEKKDGSTMDMIKNELSFDVDCYIPKDPKDLLEVVSHCKTVLATRMHSAIFSIVADTPVRCFNWQPKVQGLFMLLEREDRLIRLNDNFYFDADLVSNQLSEDIENVELCIKWGVEMKDFCQRVYEKHRSCFEKV